jgi:hypothetical protein
VGPTAVCWYGVGDIGDDGCGKTGAVLENLGDQTEYSVLGYAHRVRGVLPALAAAPSIRCARDACGSMRCAIFVSC